MKRATKKPKATAKAKPKAVRRTRKPAHPAVTHRSVHYARNNVPEFEHLPAASSLGLSFEDFAKPYEIKDTEPVHPSTVFLPPYAPEFQALVTEELARARALFGPMRSAHEAEGIIREEFEEWWDEVKANNRVKGLHELIQLAAMCQKAAEDVYGLGRGDA